MTTKTSADAGFADCTGQHQEPVPMTEEFDLDVFLNEIKSHNEKESYKKAVVLTHKKFNMTTPAHLFFANLAGITPGNYNMDTVNFVESNDKKTVNLYVSVDSNADFEKFRGLNSASLHFVRITKEKVFKVPLFSADRTAPPLKNTTTRRQRGSYTSSTTSVGSARRFSVGLTRSISIST